MEQLSDEAAFDREITLVRHLTRRVAEQWALLQECHEWLKAMSLIGCEKRGWTAFEARVRRHLGDGAPDPPAPPTEGAFTALADPTAWTTSGQPASSSVREAPTPPLFRR